MKRSLRRRLHQCGTGTINPDGTGVVNTDRGPRKVTFKITRAFRRGALYDASGKAYEWPSNRESAATGQPSNLVVEA